MKRLFSVFVIFLLISFFNKAQGNDNTWRLGLKASPSISWINPDIREIDYESTSLGFSYGLIADWFFSETYSVSANLFITHQGGEVSFENDQIYSFDGNNLKNRDFDLQYVEIPLLLKMRTREFGYFTFYGQFGFSPGFNIKARADDIYFDGSKENDLNIEDDVYTLKASIVMGAGVEYSLLQNTAIVMGLNYNNGFSNMFDKGSYSNKKIAARPSYVELTIGMMF